MVFLLVALTAPSAELSIGWHEMRGVQALDSVGQLVPLISALGQLAHAVYSTLHGKIYVKDEGEMGEVGRL